ncbi:MAG: BrnA antitoxin family protein [Pseudomonadota bacterium]
MSVHTRKSKAMDAAARRLQDALFDDHMLWDAAERQDHMIPEAWEDMSTYLPGEVEKHRVTLRVDAEVLKWYRKLGTGYQSRINGVLRTYMLARIAQVVRDKTEESGSSSRTPGT